MGGSKSMCPRGEEGGVMVVRRASSAMSRDGERFRPGENEGREEGVTFSFLLAPVMFSPGRDEHRLRGLSWFLVNT